MSKRMITLITSVLLAAALILSGTIGCSLFNETSSDTPEELETFNDVWDIIFQEYVEKENLDADALAEGAIRGMLEALDDPYTSYLDKTSYEEWSIDIQGSYEGIGAYVGEREGRVVIIAPIAGSPAEEAGIKSGDEILEVEGESISDMSLEEIIMRIRGERGTPVRIMVLHEGETKPEEITIVREEIELSSVSSETKEDIVYIYIGHFSERTNEEIIAILEDIEDNKEVEGIIVDLRSNPGGQVESVVDVTSHFLKEGLVFYVVDNRDNETIYKVDSRGIKTELPMVVLTDNHSASGSEVLSGALQDHGRAVIAGQTTFGKGSVNTLYKLDDGSGLLITTARWYTPNGRLIEGEGITPDYELELEWDDAIQWAIDYLKENR